MDDSMNDAFDYISDRHILEAAAPKKRHPVKIILSSIAAVLAVIIAWCAIWKELGSDFRIPILQDTTAATREYPDTTANTIEPTPDTTVADPVPDPTVTEPAPRPTVPPFHPPEIVPLSHQAAAPSYPEMPKAPRYSDFLHEGEYYDARYAFQSAMAEIYSQPAGYADSLDGFFRTGIPVFLSGEGNRVCSPLNIYMALAMAAETADGSTRQQILELLGADSTEALRTQVSHVWNAHYRADGQTTSLLAASVWLDEACAFREDTVQTLADSYYASAFHGDLGSDEMNRELTQWLNQNTGNLLTEQTGNIKLDPDTIFALATTAYLAADWEMPFYISATAPDTFHGTREDVEVDFMFTSLIHGTYYRGDNFGAIRLALSGDHGMWLVLPDEGATVNQVLSGREYWDLISSPDTYGEATSAIVDVRLPKFDVAGETDLRPGLEKLGVRDAFDYRKADFSPLTPAKDIFITQASHAARVTVDEEGIQAAAYTFLTYGATGMPEPLKVDFTLNRPFFFAVTSKDNLPMFTGIVEQP